MKTIIILFFSVKAFGQAGMLDPSFGIGGKVIKSSASDGMGKTVIVKPNNKIVVGGEISTQSILGFGVFQFQSNGLLDSSFGNNGGTETFISNNPSDYLRAFSMVIQNDDKMIIGGTKTGADFALARYLSNGRKDSTFGNDGVTILNLGTSQDGITAMAVLPGDNIIAVGYYLKTLPGGMTVYDLALVKFNTRGNPDSSFGTNGKVLFNSSSGGTGTARSVIIQNDGKILIGARSPTSGFDKSFTLFRFKANGLADSTFGINGMTVSTLPVVQPITLTGTTDYPVDIKLLQDGKILFGSASMNTKTFNCSFPSCGKLFFSLIKYDNTGRVDSSFGTNGAVITDLLGYGENINSSIAISQNKIIVAGWTDYPGDDDDFALIRLKMDGTTDSTFGINGITTTDFGFHEDDYLYSMALQPDLKIVVTGSTIVTTGTVNTGRKPSVARYLWETGTTPVRFINVEANPYNNSVLLKWDVSNELNIKKYEIERSADGVQFIAIGTTLANQISSPVSHYSWTDSIAYGYLIFYRICSIENDGKKEYSKILKVNTKISSDILSIFPNPIKQESILYYNLSKDDKVSIILTDITGREINYFVHGQEQKKGLHTISLNFNQGIANGIYILQLVNSYEKKSIKIVKQ